MSSACCPTYSVSFVPRNRPWMRAVFRLALSIICILALRQAIDAQSTFGTVLGTVKDPSGGLVSTAKVDLINAGTNADHAAISSSNGAYEFVNVEIGTYRLTVEAPGFQKTEVQAFEVAARATMRIDVDLKLASQAVEVYVEAVSVVQTDASNV